MNYNLIRQITRFIKRNFALFCIILDYATADYSSLSFFNETNIHFKNNENTVSDIYIKTKVKTFSEDSSVVTLAEILKSVETFLDFLIIIHQKNLNIKFLLFIKLSVAFII